ncbi:hypothetical protein HNQ80_003325 [Anaerosolibacter carboniphilus]|uniref:Cyclic lactone autoinducer peptide n=1 Tax=Anaerosolibacter carboniphilus TaxID=1417629 RepID=A0A841KUB3_9FIRM|nr:hypothetical protein [Anaerosolibacter carboniphilus]MBB6217206.1 hypothetical protein [Anaerosolibacter carboniphilus]
MKKVLVAVVLMLLVNMGFSVVSNAENPRSWGIQPNTTSKAWSSDATGLEE